MTQINLDNLINAITRYVRAEISEQTQEQDADSLGTYHEERIMQEALQEVLDEIVKLAKSQYTKEAT